MGFTWADITNAREFRMYGVETSKRRYYIFNDGTVLYSRTPGSLEETKYTKAQVLSDPGLEEIL